MNLGHFDNYWNKLKKEKKKEKSMLSTLFGHNLYETKDFENYSSTISEIIEETHDNCYNFNGNQLIINDRLLFNKRRKKCELIYGDILKGFQTKLTCKYCNKSYDTFNNIGNMKCNPYNYNDIDKMDHKFKGDLWNENDNVYKIPIYLIHYFKYEENCIVDININNNGNDFESYFLLKRIIINTNLI